MALERVAPRQAVVAGQRQCFLHQLHRLAHHQGLDQAAIGQRHLRAGIEIARQAGQQPLVRQPQRFDPPHGFLHPGQGRQRRAQAGGRALAQEAEQPVARRERHAGVERAQQHRHLGLHAGVARLRARRCEPHAMVQRHEHRVEDHVVAAAGAQAQVVPAGFDLHARAVRAHQERAHLRLGIVGARPDRIPAQDRRAGRIDLAPAQAPAFGRAPRHRGRQAAARGRAEFGLDAQRVRQRHASGRLLHQLAREVFGPERARARHLALLQVLHAQHQRGRRAAIAQRADHLAELRHRGLLPAPGARRGQRQQAGALQIGEVRMGKAAVAVMRHRALAELRGQRARGIARAHLEFHVQAALRSSVRAASRCATFSRISGISSRPYSMASSSGSKPRNSSVVIPRS